MTTDAEYKFFDFIDIAPVMLSECSFQNLRDYRLEIGDDCCEHLEDEDFSCELCGKSKQYIPLYPTITPRIIMELMNILIDNGQILKIREASLAYKDDTKYIINAENVLNNSFYGTGVTIDDAILNICTRFEHLKPQFKLLFA